jgi:hypothetical protein
MNRLDRGSAPQEEVSDQRRRTARRAGAWYLVMAVGTAFGMGYVNPLLRASSDGAATASAIRSSEALVHAGLAATAIGMVAMLFLAGALYELFEAVDRAQARMLVVFVVAGVSITMLDLAGALVAVGLARGDGFAVGLEPAHRIGLMGTSLAAYRFGGLMAAIFWGLWLLPFGRLLLRSGFAPRVLGVLMTIGCFAYLLHVVAELFLPSIRAAAAWGLAIPTVGEVGTIGWLLFRGPPSVRASAS